jgi:hypothetical protein
MRTALAFLLLLVFCALILAGSFLAAICPLEIFYYQNGNPWHLRAWYLALYIALAFALFAAAYVGGYLLIKYKASRYLTQKIGYGRMVNLGFLLQLLMGGLFCMAVLGEMQGSLLGKIVVILLLCLPFIVRKLIRLTARDRSFDTFLQEDPREQ